MAQTTNAVSPHRNAQTHSASLSLTKSVLSLVVLVASSELQLTSHVFDAIRVAQLAWVLLQISALAALAMPI